MPEPVRLALIWHLHQPSYRDPETGAFTLPWTRLHATKDYGDMAAVLVRYPRVRVTFNLTPVLLDQLDAVAAGALDPWLAIARVPAERLSAEERRFLLERFFDLNAERMLEPHEPYRELHRRVRDAGRDGGVLTPREMRDLQVWFHLAWVDPVYHDEEPIRSLLAKGRGFTEEEKNALLDWGVAASGAVQGAYRALAASGQIELTTSAYHHPILPLVIDSESPREVSPTIQLPSPPFRALADAAEQMARSRISHARRFGSPPRGTWPPEGAVSDAAIGLLAREGFAWAASDEAVLDAALRARDGGVADRARALYQPYRVETPDGALTMVFRDRRLSDLIGFTYARWDPEEAANDFLDRVRAAGDAFGPGERPLVTVILDGENCWEHYAADGHPFLAALYGKLDTGEAVRAVTVSEGLDQAPPRETLRHVPVGSWIRADLGIWVGHPERNRAWEELGGARQAVEASARAGAPGETIASARDAIYAAEASDWFWWYGDDHPTAHAAEFDRLFRSLLTYAHERVGAPVPASLRESLREETGPGEGRLDAPRLLPYVRAVLDGIETDFFEWRGARVHRPDGSSGSMHRTSGAIDAVRFGSDGKTLFIRVDWKRERPSVGSLAIRFPGPPERAARVPLDGPPAGSTIWEGDPGEHADPLPGAGRYAVGDLVELALPLEACGPVGGPARFCVAFEVGGRAEEVVPATGWFACPIGASDPGLILWSA